MHFIILVLLLLSNFSLYEFTCFVCIAFDDMNYLMNHALKRPKFAALLVKHNICLDMYSKRAVLKASPSIVGLISYSGNPFIYFFNNLCFTFLIAYIGFFFLIACLFFLFLIFFFFSNYLSLCCILYIYLHREGGDISRFWNYYRKWW